MQFWEAEFNHSHKSTGDDERLVHPKIATTKENITKVHQMVVNDFPELK